MNNNEKRILQELIYQRVRASVNLCQLVTLERELIQSVQRVRGHQDGDGPSAAEIARGYLEEACQRLEEEWREMLKRISAMDDD